jgi:hypothetical protein
MLRQEVKLSLYSGKLVLSHIIKVTTNKLKKADDKWGSRGGKSKMARVKK